MKKINDKLSSAVLLVVLIISIFVLFFTASVSYKQFQSVTESEKLVIHSHKVIRTLEELVSVVKDAETGQRGYLLTRDSSFLEPYTMAIERLSRKKSFFESLTQDDDIEQNKIDSLYKLIDYRFIMLESNLNNQSIEYTLSASAKKLLITGSEVMDEIREKTATIIENEKSKLVQRQHEHANETKISPITFLYTALFSLLIFVIAFYKIYKDIDRLKKANNQLLINKRLFEHSESISKICNWCWNIESDIVTFSNNIYNLLMCSEDDFKESFDGFSKFIHPEDKHIFKESAEKALNEHDTSIAYFRIIREDNELRYFKSVSRIITDNFDKDIMIGVIKDITEYHMDSKILEDKVFDLERTNKELLAFNHVASHDLQEPLRKIQTFISRIESEDTEHHSENVKKYFSRIRFAAKRMQKLIDDLLAFSRTNKSENAYERTDLNVVMENSIQDLTELIDEKQATINTVPLLTINAIPFQVQQLFTNLIGNALKYSKEDVLPVITISAEKVCGKNLVKSEFNSENDLLKITFTDNGIGFEQEYAEGIFTLFNRLHNKNEYSGSGIGLAICKKIVENHRGFITAESIAGVGSKFTVILPIANK